MSIFKESKLTRIVAGVVGVSNTLSLFVGVGASKASAQGIKAAQLVELFISLGIIAPDKAAAARAALGGDAGGSAPTGGYTFTRDLKLGMSGDDVKNLQMVLNMSADTQVSAAGAGSKGMETTYFGKGTLAAVKAFQSKYGIAPVAGYVGTKTRMKLQEVSAPAGGGNTGGGNTGGGNTGGGTTPPPAPGTGLMVSSVQQPEANLAPQNAARVPFTKFTVTAGNDGDVTVSGVTVERRGLAADAAFAGVVLLDEDGAQIGIARTFNSNHQAVVGADSAFTVKKGTSRTLTIAGNMASDNSTRTGQVAQLAVVSVNAGSAVVNGTFPIVGTGHTVNSSLSIGTVTTERGPLDPNGAQTKNVGTTGYTFSSVKVTAGSVEKVRIHSIRWNQASSSAASDLANVKTVVDTVEYPATISADGKYYTSKFGSGIVVDKGLSKEISIKADIVSGSSRTIAFNIEKTTDMYVTGEQYNFGITPPTNGTGFTAGSIWYPSSTVTIDAGSMTVENATSVAAGNVAPNLSNQALGGFSVEVKGEPITVGQMQFNIATTGTPTTGGANQLVTNATIVDENGTVVAGPVDATEVNATTQRLTFTDTVLFGVGKKVYKVLGKVGSNFASSGTIIVSTTPGGGSAPNWSTITGQVTSKTITPSTAAVTMNTMTVKGAALTISVSQTPAAQTIVAGAQQFNFANYQLDASASGEDVRLSSIPLETAVSSGASNITACTLYDGDKAVQTGSNVKDSVSTASSTSFTFDTPLTVQKGTIKTLALKCNIASGATGVYQFGYDSSSSPSATGMTSGQSVTVTEVDSVGQRMTLTSGGALTVTLDSSSPSYAIAAAGETATLSVLRFHAANESIALQDVALQLTNTASSSASDLQKVTLWANSEQIGEAIFTGTNTLATTTLTKNVIVPKDGDLLVTVKGQMAAQGMSQVGAYGALVAVDFDGAATTGTSGIGQQSGTTIEAGSVGGADTASSGVRAYRSYPTLALVDLPSTKLVSGRQDIMRFKVSANAAGDVGVARFTFRVATSSATSQSGMLTNFNIYVFTDSGYSTVASGVQTDGALYATSLGGEKWVTSSTDLELWAADSSNASTTVVVPAGQTRYFAIRADVVTAGTQFSASTQLQGDSKFLADYASGAFAAGSSGTAAGSAGTYLATSTYLLTTTGDNDFVWRPFSTTTTQSRVANDFSNGYGVPGLPNSNTNAQTLTQ